VFSDDKRCAGRLWGLVMISDGQADSGQRDIVIIGNGQADSGQRDLVVIVNGQGNDG